MKKGTLKADGIVVGELNVSFLGPALTFEAKIAFVNSKTGATHGWTQHKQWSKTTLQKLEQLREAMDEDVAAAHLEEFSTVREGTTSIPLPDAGLGEHLAEKTFVEVDAPPI